MVGEKSLTILQLNDSHGYFESHPELFWEGSREIYRGASGYSRISTLFNRIREERGEAIIALRTRGSPSTSRWRTPGGGGYRSSSSCAL